jgi:Na+-translocating ferredoxin:NAD+ oxidoreductase RnfC subunit
MKTFFDWLELLSWGQALIFLAVLCIGACALICGSDWAIRKLIENAEQRAIKERNWAEKKRRAQYLMEAKAARQAREADDAQFLQRLNIDIASDDAQRNRERQQFHLPAAFRDFKGVTKQ